MFPSIPIPSFQDCELFPSIQFPFRSLARQVRAQATFFVRQLLRRDSVALFSNPRREHGSPHAHNKWRAEIILCLRSNFLLSSRNATTGHDPALQPYPQQRRVEDIRVDRPLRGCPLAFHIITSRRYALCFRRAHRGKSGPPKCPRVLSAVASLCTFPIKLIPRRRTTGAWSLGLQEHKADLIGCPGNYRSLELRVPSNKG